MQLTLFDNLGDDNPLKPKTSTDWKWWLKDLESIPKNNRTVFSTFACGGGEHNGL